MNSNACGRARHAIPHLKNRFGPALRRSIQIASPPYPPASTNWPPDRPNFANRSRRCRRKFARFTRRRDVLRRDGLLLRPPPHIAILPHPPRRTPRDSTPGARLPRTTRGGRPFPPRRITRDDEHPAFTDSERNLILAAETLRTGRDLKPRKTDEKPEEKLSLFWRVFGG